LFRVTSINKIPEDKDVQDYLNSGQDNHKNVGFIVYEFWTAGCCHNCQNISGRLYYMQPKMKKIDDVWQLHGKNIQMIDGTNNIYTCTFKKNEFNGMQTAQN